MARLPPGRPLRAVLAALAVALSAAGCVSMPSGGPVLSYPITQQQPDQQNQNNVQIEPQPPGEDWKPKQIVEGFLTAAASFGNYAQVAEQYLTANGRAHWSPSWSAAVVYKKGPNVRDPVFAAGSAKQRSATVAITGTVEASLQGFGSYSVASASTPNAGDDVMPFTLVQEKNGQWRIDQAPNQLLLTSDSFANDYELRRLYFFDPISKYLVPDPVYVPLTANLPALVNGLVNDLITQPKDWLSKGSTHTAIPAGTKILGVTLSGGAAVVNLGGSIAKARDPVLRQVSDQLLWTLTGAAQSGVSGAAVRSVELEVNGNQWIPSTGQGNPVQRQGGSLSKPASGASSGFYYIDPAGYLVRQDGAAHKAIRIRSLGTKYTQLAVSPGGKYVALLSASGGTLFTGPLDGPLVDRGSGYTAMSWDASGQLWVSDGDQLFMLRGGAGPQQPLGLPVPVDVIGQGGVKDMGGPWTALRVAPDGVRVALVSDHVILYVGAINVHQGTRPGQVSIQIVLSPVEDVAPGTTEFAGLTWYGPDNVITLTDQDYAVTEYPVSGGATTTIPPVSGMQSIMASYGQPLIGGAPNSRMVANASLSSAWQTITDGTLPAYPG